MLNKNSIESVFPLVERLEAAGQVATPMPGTPLDSLVKAGIDPVGSHIDPTAPDSPYSIVAESQVHDMSGVAQHQATLEVLVETIAKTVESNINVAKNVVKPTIQALVDAFDGRVGTARANAENVISIVPDFFDKIWSNPVITGMVETFAQAPVRKKKLSIIFPSISMDEMMQLLNTGSARFDEELGEWLQKVGMEKVMDAYAQVFALSKRFQELEVAELLSPYRQDRDILLLVHLMARKLLQSPPEGMEVPLIDYREYVALIQEQSGRAVCRVLEKREMDAGSKTLVTEFPIVRLDQVNVGGDVSIHVNGEVYNRWLEEGGTPEVLFGAYVSDQARSYTRLLAEREQYEAVWKRELTVIQTRVRFEMINIKLDALRAALADVINGLDDEQVIGVRQELHLRAKEELAKITAPMLDNIYVVARRLVCRSMFSRTDAEKILVAIDNAALANPDMDIQDAALLGTAEYVSLWVASQIIVERA